MSIPLKIFDQNSINEQAFEHFTVCRYSWSNTIAIFATRNSEKNNIHEISYVNIEIDRKSPNDSNSVFLGMGRQIIFCHEQEE